MSGLDGIVADGATVQELPRGWDVGGGSHLLGRGCDGPVWLPEAGCWAFSDAGHARRLTWAPGQGIRVLQAETGRVLGAALDAEGRLVSCELDTKQVTRVEPDGTVTVLAEDSGFLGPDDVAIAADGAVWFSDLLPDVGAPPDARSSAIYRISPAGDVEVAVDGLEAAGGLAFSPDGSTLYVTETRRRELLAVDLATGSRRVLVTMTEGLIRPHGIAVDEAGRIYCGGPGGIWVIDPSGAHLGTIAHPATMTTNLAFGGPDGRTLLFTTLVAAGSIELQVRGAQLPASSAGVARLVRESTPITLPSRIERLDPRIDAILAPDAEVELLAIGGVFDDLGDGPHGRYARSLEGTLWDQREGHLCFSDFGNDRRLRWKEGELIAVVHPHTNHTNGTTFDNDGAFISAEHATRRISRLARDGTYSVVADRYDGKRLGRCNDVVCRSDGTIYFTSPWWDFGDDAQQEAPVTFYRVAPDGEVTPGTDNGWTVPNGLALDPDENVLYVNDSRRMVVFAYDVFPDGKVDLASERVFFQFPDGEGSPDGMKVDLDGNVYCGGPDGLWIIAADGTHLGTIVAGPVHINNIAFGGHDWRTLYFCSWTSLYRIPLLVAGVPVPRGSVRRPA